MSIVLKDRALLLLRKALNNPTADFRDGQWEAIAALIKNQSRLLVVQRTGWGKSLVYFLATRLLRDQGAGSVVHYYQQVGRAGRAVEQAYGILLSGNEDEDITNYFIRTAFPPEAHTQQVLYALNQADDGFSIPQLEQQLNLSRGQMKKEGHYHYGVMRDGEN